MDASELQCIICPRQPAFSDVSHLLTHVSSKAHLAHQFKLQVRGHQDAEAAELSNAFNDWYAANNITQLLSDRDASKADRQNKRRSSGKKTGSSPSTDEHTLRAPLPAHPVDAHSDAMVPLPANIDPRLGEPYTPGMHEANTGSVTSAEEFDSSNATRSTSVALAIDPCLEAYFDHDSVYSAGNTETASGNGHDTVNLNKSQVTSFLETPRALRTRNIQKAISSQQRANRSESFGDNRTHVGKTVGEFDDENDGPDEMTRLKGIQWPGMDIFDAATQQMRRKRNQKKDGTILKQMETTSRLVEPTEQIFSSAGALLKERVITGNIDDDSPVEGEDPIPKKRPVRGKQGALRENDPNIAFAKDRKRVKRDVPQSRDAREHVLENNEREVSIYHKRPFGSAWDGEEEEGLGFTARTFRKRTRAGFAVYNDDHEAREDRLVSMVQDHSGQPIDVQASRGTLTPTRLMLDSKPKDSYNHGHTIQSPLGKENIEPFLNTHGRIDPLIWNPMSPFSNTQTSNMNGDDRYYFNDPSAAGFSLTDTRNNYGYQINPLLAPTSKMAMFEHQSYDEDVIVANSGWAASSRAVSSDATISEQDLHDRC
jgi:hypothetical protein